MFGQNVTHGPEKNLGHYRFIQRLEENQTGEVWLAEDQRDQRQLSIKLLPARLATEYAFRQRFRREMRGATALKHPHILPILEYGEDISDQEELVCYLVMPYISGGTLSDHLKKSKSLLPTSECLLYLKQAAEAIDYIHSQGLIHCDITPANMLLKENWLFLRNFGIARLLSSDTYRSRTEAGTNTPGYLAPEQVQQRAEAASDRYSLGILAYRIFTGMLPFSGKNPYAIMLQQLEDQPPAPHTLNPDLPALVATVLVQALSKEPAERYPSCLAFIAALEQAWHVHPAAERISHPQDMFATQQEDRSLTIAEQVLEELPASPEASELVMAPMILKQLFSKKSEHIIQTELAEDPQQEKKHRRGPGRRAVLIGGMATILLAAGGSTALVLLKKAQVYQPIITGPLQLVPAKVLMILTGHTKVIENVVWDPTTRYLATAGEDTHVMLWDVGNSLKHFTSIQTLSQPTRKWKFTYDIQGNFLHWTLDGRKLIISDNATGVFTLLDPFSPQSSRQIFSSKTQDLFTTYTCVVPQPHSTVLAGIVDTSSGSIAVNFWQLTRPDASIGQLSYSLPASQKLTHPRLTALAWSCDGIFLAGQLTSQQLIIWNAQTRKVHIVIAIPPRKGHGVVNITKVPLAWSPTNPHILAAFNIDTLAIIDIQQARVLYQLGTDDRDALTAPPPGSVPWYQHLISLTWSPDGRYIAGSYSRSARIHIWDLQAKTNKTSPNGEILQHYLIPEAGQAPGHTETIFDLAWSPDGRYLATSSFDLSTIIWQVGR